jgi:hypothetical protein
MLRDATQAMLEVLIDSVQFNDFWCLDCLFNPPDLDLSLDQHRARVAE